MPKKLRVLPNPFIHLDEDGIPAGACPADRMEHTGPSRRAWVGATLDLEKTVVLEKLEPGDPRYPAQKTVFKFSTEPVDIPKTPYYIDRIQCNEIICADAETAKAAGVKFKDPAVALAEAKAKAIADWRAGYGEDPPGCPSDSVAAPEKSAAARAK